VDIASGHNERVQNADPVAGVLELLRTRGVEVVVRDDQRSVDMMRSFQSDNPELWAEDIAE